MVSIRPIDASDLGKYDDLGLSMNSDSMSKRRSTIVCRNILFLGQISISSTSSKYGAEWSGVVPMAGVDGFIFDKTYLCLVLDSATLVCRG